MLLQELQDEINRFGSLEPWMKVRYAIAMAHLVEQQRDMENAGQASRVALDNLTLQEEHPIEASTRLWLEKLRRGAD